MDKTNTPAHSAALRQRIEDVSALVLVEYERLTVAESEDLRKKFREAGCSFRVYKNSIVRYAVVGTPHEAVVPLLAGVTGLAFNADDPGAPARVARDYAKTNDKVRIKGGVIDGEMLDAARCATLADMPGPRELKAQFLALLNTPATSLVRVLSAAPQSLLYLLNARKDKLAA
jgi:large subunit ribosomal protein L10